MFQWFLRIFNFSSLLSRPFQNSSLHPRANLIIQTSRFRRVRALSPNFPSPIISPLSPSVSSFIFLPLALFHTRGIFPSRADLCILNSLRSICILLSDHFTNGIFLSILRVINNESEEMIEDGQDG